MNLLILQNEIFSLSSARLMAIDETIPGIKMCYTSDKSVTEEQISEADIIFGWPPRRLLKYAVKLKWLHTPSTGLEQYADLNLFINKDIILTRSGGAHNIQTAEHVMAMILALNRRLGVYFKNQTEHNWARAPEHLELYGKTVCVVGLGTIGKTLCSYLKAFGCKTLGIRRRPMLKPDFVDEQYGSEDLTEVLGQSDYVCVCLPSTPETDGMFSDNEFNLMKRGAIFINIARGKAANHDALVRALEAGRLGGAGLDVTDPEPLFSTSPLWDMENVIITPHTAGFSDGLDLRRFEIFLDLLRRFMSNGRMYNTVDFIRGY